MKIKLALCFGMMMYILFIVPAVFASALTVITDIPPEGLPIKEAGTYYFADDLEWKGQEGVYAAITIEASDVVLDMKGHSLSAPRNVPLSGTFGIIADKAHRVSLRNGTIKGFQLIGIHLANTEGATLSDLVISDVGNGVPGYTPTGLYAETCQDLTLDNVSVRNINGSWSANILSPGQIVSGISLKGCTDVNINGRVSGINGYSTVVSGVMGINCHGIKLKNLEIDNVNGSGVNVSGASFLKSTGLSIEEGLISNLHNDAGVCSGIATDDSQRITVLNTTVRGLSTGLMPNKDAVGHTCIGMVFAPSQVVEGGVSEINVVNPGAGYSPLLPPLVVIDKPQLSSGSQAVGIPVIGSNGELESILILKPGSGYKTAPNVEIFPDPLWPDGTGATATAEVSTTVEQKGSANDIVVEQCNISDITGSCDDAHGISLFVVSDATVRNVTVENVTDGRGGRGAKATGIEVYGLVNNQASNILVENCQVRDISAISPGDLQAAGYSVAGKGVTFRNCEASNVTVSGANPVDPTSPGYGIGFGWAPDIREQYQYPALETRIENCTASKCQVGFDTFYFQNSTLSNIKSLENDVDIKTESTDVIRWLYCDKCSECPLSPEESPENWFAEVPVQNIASGNIILPPHR